MRARDVMDIETDAIKPIRPLTPDQARRRSAKQVKVQRQMRDEGQRHAENIRVLMSSDIRN
jgi:hypothetical protein